MDYPTTLARMERDLRRCRRKIVLAAFSARMRYATGIFARFLVGIGGIALILRIATGSFPESSHILILAGGVAASTLGLAVWRTFSADPIDFGNAAERLDLSQSTHNRIATAIDLLRSGDDSEFAKAAIRDGQENLARLQQEQPFLDSVQTAWHRLAGLILVGIVLIVITTFVNREPAFGGDVAGYDNPGDPDTVRPEDSSANLHPKSESPKPRPEKEMAAVSDRTGGQSPDGGERERPRQAVEMPTSGSPGQHSSGSARRSQTVSSSRSAGSASSGAGAKTNPMAKGIPKRKQIRSAKPPAKEKVGKKSQKGGSINARGSSGSGAMKTSESDWSSKVEARAGDQDDSVDEDEPDEDADGEKQRLGMQPGLKNRVSRVSRELSLSMGNGVDNSTTKGRGGPSPQKKSRGTTTMILGVPIPGFVRGRLLPGATKSTQEEAEPSSRQSSYTSAETLTPVAPQEDYQERFRPPLADSLQASQYLIDLHKQAENTSNKKKD